MRFRKWKIRRVLAAVKREAAAAVWPAAIAAVFGPMLVALIPGLRGVAAEVLPPGPERLLLSAVVFALGAEVVRCHFLKFSLSRRLRAAGVERDKQPVAEAP